MESLLTLFRGKLSPTWTVKRFLQTSHVKCYKKKSKKRMPPPPFDIENIGLEKPLPKDLLNNATTFEHSNIAASPETFWATDPYKGARKLKKEMDPMKYAFRPPVDPSETSLIFFPGQGAQYVGMGEQYLKYPNVKEMYEHASEILEYDILKLCLEGPAHKLRETKYQQPAIFLASLAAMEKLRAINPQAIDACVGTAGFSVGEITALTFAEAFSFEDALRLVSIRAEAMQVASELNPGGMATIFYDANSDVKMACNIAKQVCINNGIDNADCRIANFLTPNIKVISGNEEALQFIMDKKDDFKIKKVRRLDVSGAFHSELMKSATHVFAEALENVKINNPLIPVHSNINGKMYRSARSVLRTLPRQICHSVRWEQTMHILFSRPDGVSFPNTYVCGPGKELLGLIKMVNMKAWESAYSVDTLKS